MVRESINLNINDFQIFLLTRLFAAVLFYLIMNKSTKAYLAILSFIILNVFVDVVYYYGRARRFKKGKRVRYIVQSIFNVFIYGSFLVCNAFNKSYLIAIVPLTFNFFFNIYNNCSCHDDVGLLGGPRCNSQVLLGYLPVAHLCTVDLVHHQAQ